MFGLIKVFPIKHGSYISQLTPHVYLHGELQEWNGFDLCLVQKLPEAEGIYECETIFDDGHIIPSILFFWHGPEPFTNRGLIVDKRDKASMEDARQKFEQRATSL